MPGASTPQGQLRARELASLRDLVDELQRRTSLPPARLRAALERVLPLAAAQADRAEELRERLIETLLTDLDVLDPVPHASVAQARRVAALRNRLLASGAWTISALAEARGTSRSTARTWLTRHRAADRLVSVTVRGETYVPALLLDEAADPYRDAATILEPLREAGMDAWAVWAWLDSPSPWLDGDRPADLLARGATERAARAARAQAASAAPGGAAAGVA